jgi:CheY-like chemotaxis protein
MDITLTHSTAGPSLLMRPAERSKKARAAGCNHFVPKPYSPHQLLAKIRNYLDWRLTSIIATHESAIGTKRTSSLRSAMSAFGGIADVTVDWRNVRF